MAFLLRQRRRGRQQRRLCRLDRLNIGGRRGRDIASGHTFLTLLFIDNLFVEILESCLFICVYYSSSADHDSMNIHGFHTVSCFQNSKQMDVISFLMPCCSVLILWLQLKIVNLVLEADTPRHFHICTHILCEF